jgi:hypothetical protein
VIRHVAAALDLEHLDAPAAQRLDVQGEARGLGAAAERDDGGVLAENEEVGGELAGQAVVGEAALEGEGVSVRDGAEVVNGESEGSQRSEVRG